MIDSIIFGIEYLYKSAMEYLNNTYHRYPTALRDYDVPDAIMRQINEGASAAAYAAESYTGEVDGRTVV